MGLFARTNNLGMTRSEEKAEAKRIGRQVAAALDTDDREDTDYQVIVPGPGERVRMTRQR